VARVNRWVLLMGLCGLLLLLSASSELQSWGDGAIGITVLHGVNAGFRNQVYLGALLLAFAILSQISMLSNLRIEPEEKIHPATVWGGLLLANGLLYLFAGESLYLHASIMLLLLALLYRQQGSSFLPAAILAHQLLLSLFAFTAIDAPSWQVGLLLFVVLELTTAYLLDRGMWLATRRGCTLAMVVAALPLLGIVARELAYSTRWAPLNLPVELAIFAGLILLLVLLCSRLQSRGQPFVERLLFPLAIMGSVALAEYQLALPNWGDYDYFHTGEAVLPVQQLLAFGKLPHIDYQPAHGLFDLFPQGLYVLLNPGAGVEMLSWGEGYMNGWLPRAMAAGIVYVMLARLFTPLMALGLMLFLPGYHLVPPYYALLLLPPLWMLRERSDPNLQVYWVGLFLLTLLLGLWRVDFGIATLLGVFILLAYRAQEARARVWATGLRSLAIVAGPALVIFMLLAWWRDQSAWTLLLQLYQYVSIQTASASHLMITRSWDMAAVLQYALLPLVAVSHLVIQWHNRRRGPLDQVMVLLSIVALVMATRSLHRHSLYVGAFNPYLFSLLTLALYRYRRSVYSVRPAVLVPVLVAMLYLLLPARTDIYKKVFFDFGVEREYSVLLNPSMSAALQLGADQQQRLNLPVKHVPLVQRIEQLLGEGQTFYDFTNSPLLYPLTGREVPVFMVDTVYQTSDDVQAGVLRDMQSFRQAGRLPLVIFKQSTFWDEVDGVNNEVRSPIVVEYIYQHYRPCRREGRYELWWEQGSGDCPLDAGTEPAAQSLELGLLPWLLANEIEPGRVLEVEGGAPAYLELELLTPDALELELRVGAGSITFSTRSALEPQRYLVRLSLLQAWWQAGAKYELQFGDTRILSARLLSVD
jgi:hypothetical protein